jgi:hypothetical protein
VQAAFDHACSSATISLIWRMHSAELQLCMYSVLRLAGRRHVAPLVAGVHGGRWVGSSGETWTRGSVQTPKAQATAGVRSLHVGMLSSSGSIGRCQPELIKQSFPRSGSWNVLTACIGAGPRASFLKLRIYSFRFFNVRVMHASPSVPVYSLARCRIAEYLLY